VWFIKVLKKFVNKDKNKYNFAYTIIFNNLIKDIDTNIWFARKVDSKFAISIERYRSLYYLWSSRYQTILRWQRNKYTDCKT